MTLACSFVQRTFRRVLKRAVEAIGTRSTEERYWVLRKGVVEFWHSDPVKASMETQNELRAKHTLSFF